MNRIIAPSGSAMAPSAAVTIHWFAVSGAVFVNSPPSSIINTCQMTRGTMRSLICCVPNDQQATSLSRVKSFGSYCRSKERPRKKAWIWPQRGGGLNPHYRFEGPGDGRRLYGMKTKTKKLSLHGRWPITHELTSQTRVNKTCKDKIHGYILSRSNFAAFKVRVRVSGLRNYGDSYQIKLHDKAS